MPNVAFRRISIPVAALAIAIVASRDARAQGWEPNPEQQASTEVPGTDDPAPPASDSPSLPVHFEVGGEGDYVTAPIRGGTNPFGMGFGGRAAVTIGNLFFGAKVLDFLGGSDVDVSYRSLLAGVEAGYDFRVRAWGHTYFVVRPQLGVGDAVIYYTDPSLAKVDVVTSASGSSSSKSSDTISVNNVYLDPGATVMLTSDFVYLSIGGSVLLLPGIVYGGAEATTWLSYGTRLSVGLRF